MSKKVVIETEVQLCPDVFGFDADSEKANVMIEEGGAEDCIQEAIDTCPVECIRWE
jgi:ferredoxin